MVGFQLDLAHALRLVVLPLVLVALLPWRAYAAGGVDVVILVDQSGSMWGHPIHHPHANDAGGHRITAVKEVVERLASDVEGTGREQRISVFNFDKNVVPFRQDLVLSFDPNRPGEAVLQARAALHAFDEIKNMDQPWTNTPGAFAAAVSEFARWRGGSGAGRSAHLLLITDGRPYMAGRSLPELRRDLEQSAQALKDLGVQTWVVGINDVDPYWTQAKGGLVSDGEFWQHIAGDQHAGLAQSPSFPSVQRIVARFVDSWLGTASDEVVAGQPYEVVPFLRRVSFSVAFNTPGASVQVIDPHQRLLPMPPSDPDAEFIRVSIPNPEPGPYQFVLDPKTSYSIRAETLGPKAELVNPLGRQPLDADAIIIVRAMGDLDQPLALDPAQVTAAEMTVASPGGQQKRLPATPGPGARFETSWHAAESGGHPVTIRVEATHGGRRYTVFDNTPVVPAAIEVSADRPLFLSLIEPQPDASIIDFPPIHDLAITVALVDASGAPIDRVSDYVASPAQWLSVVSIDASGVPMKPPLVLGFGADNRWHGVVPVNADWTTGAGWYSPAQVFLHFQPAQDLLANNHVLSGLKLPPTAIDRRVAGDGLSVGPIELRWPGWLRWAILLAIALAVIGGVVLAAWLIVRAVLLRSLEDPRRGRLELRIFDSIRDPHGLNARTIPVHGVLSLKKDEQIRTEIGGKTVIMEKFRYARSLQSRRRAMARIVYRWPGQNGNVIVNADGPARLLAAPKYETYSVALVYTK